MLIGGARMREKSSFKIASELASNWKVTSVEFEFPFSKIMEIPIKISSSKRLMEWFKKLIIGPVGQLEFPNGLAIISFSFIIIPVAVVASIQFVNVLLSLCRSQSTNDAPRPFVGRVT